MYDREHKEYLKKIRLNKFLVHLVQLLIIIVFIFLWEYLSSKNIINSFIYSSPSKAINTIYGLYVDGELFNQQYLELLLRYCYGIVNFYIK